jgi:hypothetical protein
LLFNKNQEVVMIGIARYLLGRCIAAALLAAVVFSGTVAFAAGEAELIAKYQSIKGSLEKNQFGAPIHLESKESGGALRVDMYGVFPHSFAVVSQALKSPANWCDITLQHLNIKACTYKKSGDQWLVTLYSGRKYYQPPADAYELKLRFRTVAVQPDYLSLEMGAKEGPLRTKDHSMEVEAAPLDPRTTLVHFTYSYKQGTSGKLAIKSYLNTIGRDKVGFSTENKDGKKVYIGGVRGALERNTMRYYLAFLSYIDTLKVPEPQRFEQRISRWYDLTNRYPRQLKELEKGEYLSIKRQERNNQLALQKKEG